MEQRGRNGGVQRLCLGGVGIKGGLGCLLFLMVIITEINIYVLLY